MNRETVTGPLECLVGRLRFIANLFGQSAAIDAADLLEMQAREIERLQADAARYRWLRSCGAKFDDLAVFGGPTGLLNADALDYEVDAAMKADQPPNAGLSGHGPKE